MAWIGDGNNRRRIDHDVVVVGPGHRDQAFARRGALVRLEAGLQLGDGADALGHGAEELTSIGEVVVEGALGQAGLGGDGFDGDEPASRLRENADRGIDEALARRLVRGGDGQALGG